MSRAEPTSRAFPTDPLPSEAGDSSFAKSNPVSDPNAPGSTPWLFLKSQQIHAAALHQPDPQIALRRSTRGQTEERAKLTWPYITGNASLFAYISFGSPRYRLTPYSSRTSRCFIFSASQRTTMRIYTMRPDSTRRRSYACLRGILTVGLSLG
jgi:hypothetical protein